MNPNGELFVGHSKHSQPPNRINFIRIGHLQNESFTEQKLSANADLWHITQFHQQKFAPSPICITLYLSDQRKHSIYTYYLRIWNVAMHFIETNIHKWYHLARERNVRKHSQLRSILTWFLYIVQITKILYTIECCLSNGRMIKVNRALPNPSLMHYRKR